MGGSVPALGLDFGTRRIGLAVTDPEGRLALPAGVLERRDLERDLAALAELVAQRGIRQLVLGLPLHMDGRPGDMAEMVRDFAGRLERATGLPVELLDERWTSREAERALRDAGAPRTRRPAKRQRKAEGRAAPQAPKARAARRGRAESTRAGRRAKSGQVDSVAATLLLRTWLERRARQHGDAC